ncbi:SwmB domain-containing protein [Aquimarina sp. RZ0]|uniref:SwmB domain-containing protein n=1 Tax=Aquimarina sp. RZ0 TaxID=2607730 RepID=UPI0011F0C57D|nr:SwmB domain-containing protein [Aquimarina sp. RZ0]KAA1243391.1 hypothetical protein F0000_21275 [Aquimarina sp. RZ0]
MKICINKYKLLIPISALIITVVGCEESNLRDGFREQNFKPTANTTLITEGQTITYTDLSKNVSIRSWTFEGGDIESSDQEIIDVTYDDHSPFEPNASGGFDYNSFKTGLEVDYDDGTTQSNRFNVTVYPKIDVDFTANKTTSIFGSIIDFEDLTIHEESAWPEAAEEDTFLWEFEGGIPATSKDKNPSILYSDTGKFSVKLTVHREAPESDVVLVRNEYINIVSQPAISPLSTILSSFGKIITLTYEEGISTATPMDASAFSVAVDGTAATIASVALDGADPSKIVITLDTSVTEGQDITISYNGNIVSVSGAVLAGLTEVPVTNTVVNLFRLYNADFEQTAVGSFPDGYGTWNETAGANNNEKYVTSDVDPHGGAKCLEIRIDATDDKWNLESGFSDAGNGHVTIEEGEYRLIFWAKASTPGITMGYRAVAQGWAHNDGSSADLTTEWVEYSADFSTVGNTTLNRKYWQQIQSNIDGAKVYIDDIKLYRID